MRTTFIMLSRALFGIFRDHKLTAAMNEKQFFDPSHANRVHVFHGTFASKLAATSYCFDAHSRNEPEPLTRDLPDAMIDTAEVEIIFGTAPIGGAVPMLTQYTENLFNEIGSDNTLVLIAEAAFGGSPYSLNDTPMLRYAGAFDVL